MPAGPGGVVHVYQKYDPKSFPPPLAEPPDLASAAMEHMLEFGSMRAFTDEELANAVRLDPSMFPRLGPSLESLSAMLRERRRKLLATYEVDGARREADRAFRDQAGATDAPREFRDDLGRAVRSEQIADLERLWYKQKREDSPFAAELLRLMESLGVKYQLDELASKYAFTGRQGLTPAEALALKEELETIDKLLQQLEEAAKNARLAIIDLESLAEFADGEEGREQIESLNRIQQQIEDYLREQARLQGVEKSRQGYGLGPQAYRLFQRKLLTEIFSSLQAARSGRHTGPIIGDGAVEIERTRGYQFGDSAAHLDVTRTITNAAVRGGFAPRTGPASPARPRVRSDDIEIHETRNSPKCATMVVMDMSGSMRYNGAYVNVKRMALALDGLIRAEYPGDLLGFVEMYSFAKRRTSGELAAMMPKPVSIHRSSVRLRADMSNPDLGEAQVPQHFTNIQHALELSRRVLSAQDTPNRQVILITDGLPTAHFEGKDLYLLYPPDPRTEDATMREAMRCSRESITLNIFLLPSWSQSSEDIRFAHGLAESTRGRVFFSGGRDLDRFVLWDYVNSRRAIFGA